MDFNEKQLAIINTAEKLFSVNGFDGTSVRDIASGAGINVAMVSYYFGSKEKLMEAVFEQRSNTVRIKVENLLQNQHYTHLEKINILIDDYIEKFLSKQEFHKILMREQLKEKGSHIATLIHDLKIKNLETIKKLITDGQKCGEFRKHIDMAMMMATLVGTASQIITSQRFYREISNMKDVTDAEFEKYMKKKLNTHLKNLFKAMLTHEA